MAKMEISRNYYSRQKVLSLSRIPDPTITGEKEQMDLEKIDWGSF